MKMLVKFEFLKILRRKSTFIVMLVSLLIVVFLFGLQLIQYQTYNEDGVIKGLDGITYKKEQYKDFSVFLTDDYIYETIRDYQKEFENPDNVGYDGNERFLIGDAYWNFVAPREKLLNIIAGNYNNPKENNGLNKLIDLNITNGAYFYQTREEKIETLLNSLSREFSDNQKEYWRDMSSQVKTPLKYGYYEGWEVILSSFELLMFALLAICIVISPVFSGEYQAGTDAVILSGKYGRTKLITAKIISSFVFGTLAFIVHIVVACGVPLIAFGVEGWNLSLQIANTVIPYPLTFMQTTIMNVGVIYLVLLAMIGLTLLLSAMMKNSYLVLVVLVPVLFFPMFLTPNGTTGIYNLILFLLPYRATMPEISKYISYEFGSFVFDALFVRAILYGTLTVIMLPLIRLAFKKHQV